MKNDLRWRLGTSGHPKVVRLVQACGERAFRALACLWEWTAANRPDGNLRGMDDLDVAIAAGWTEGMSKFVAQLVALRLLDGADGKYRIHDWAEEQPWVVGSEERSQAARVAGLASAAKRQRKANEALNGIQRPVEREATEGSTDFNSSPSPSPSPLLSESSPTQNQNYRLVPEDGDPVVVKPEKAEPKRKDLPPLIALWNRIAAEAKLPRVTDYTALRQRQVKAALADEPDLAVWERAFRAIIQSKWHRGGGENGWKANFTYAMRPEHRANWLDLARNNGATSVEASPMTPEERAADAAARRERTRAIMYGTGNGVSHE